VSPAWDNRDAAIYCRTAVADHSIREQREACQAFAARHGYTVPEAYVCLDDGCSGTHLERPGLQQLRELIRTRAIQAVIVHDLARLARTLPHLLRFADECAEADVAVHAVRSPGLPRPEVFMVMRQGAEADQEEGGVTR
jgi:DNA invertase Pin-like site-specific DNA recombinase